MTSPAAPARLSHRRLPAAVGLVLAALATPGCTGESEDALTTPQLALPVRSGELSSLSFEAVVIVDPSANNLAVLERVRHELRSALSALPRRQVALNQSRQVDLDLKRLSREPVTVVDPITRATRPAVRVRYRFLGLGLVPTALARRGEALLGLLHRDDAARAAEVIAACTAPADRVGEAATQPWRGFDPGLEACEKAIEAEQAKIDEARAGLEHPDREIVPLEQERLFLPVVLHVRSRAAKRSGSAPAEPDGEGSAHAAGTTSRPGDRPSDPAAAPRGSADPADLDPAAVLAEVREARLLARLKTHDKDTSAPDDEEDEALRRRVAGSAPAEGSGSNLAPISYGGHESQPLNYALLWFASIAVVALLGTEIRRRLLRRGKPTVRTKRR